MTARPRILVVTGPTASGKSDLAMVLAESLGGEIIGADSVQVYRGFDIGSAKPTAAERARVRHHLVDTKAPEEGWSAGAYVRDADAAIEDIARRGRVPIVCGGTGLYVRSLLRGLAPTAPSDAALRASFEPLEDAALHARLTAVDPEAAARLPAADRVRVVRALEVAELTGRPITAWNAEHALAEERYDALVIALTRPRQELHARVASRAAAMVEAGLLDEVRGLLDGGLAADHFALRTIGYREAVDVLRGDAPRDGLVTAITVATRRYVRRQLVFLRGQLDARWLVPPATPAEGDRVLAQCAAWWQGSADASILGSPSEAEALARTAGFGAVGV